MEQFNCLLELKNHGIIARQYIYEVGGYRYNWHKDIEIMLVISGKVEVCVEGNVYDLGADDLIVINSNIGHASLKKEEHSIVMVLHINPIFFDLFCTEYDFIKFNCNTINKNKNDIEFKRMRKLLSEMMFSMLNNKTQGNFGALGYLSLLSQNLFEYFNDYENNNGNLLKYKKHQDRLRIAIKYIEENYRDKITLDDIAKLINYNSSYTSSFFKTYVGINFYEYLLRVRLQSAITELSTTNKTIYNIALDNGFSDVKAFNVSFKKNFNKSPNEYRITSDKIAPILSLDKRDFVMVNNNLILNKLKKYLTIDDICKDDILSNKEECFNHEKESKEFNEIRLICDKNDHSDELLNYLNKSSIKLKLEIVK